MLSPTINPRFFNEVIIYVVLPWCPMKADLFSTKKEEATPPLIPTYQKQKAPAFRVEAS
jgi:hypothetical protein